jgi:Transposase DDE domain
VDAKPQLIVVQHVTKAVTDVDQLSAMAVAARETLGVEHLKVVADMGDYHGEAINAGEEGGLKPYIPKPLTSANRTLGLYGKEQFTSASAHDWYQGPARQRLTCRFTTVELGRPLRSAATAGCRTCAIQAPCTLSQEGRRMTRWVHEHLFERRQRKVEANPGLRKPRHQIAEHPFGTIMQWREQGYFRMRCLAQVRAAMSRSALADTLKRVRPRLGVPTLTAAVT